MILFKSCGVRKRNLGELIHVVEEHTLQRVLAAVNEESPISRIVLKSAEFIKKTGDITAVHEVFLLAEVVHVLLMHSTKERDTRILAK